MNTMIYRDYWGRYTSRSINSTGYVAEVYAKSVKLRHLDSGKTTPYTVHRFTPMSTLRFDAYIVPDNGDRFLGASTITFTKYRSYGQEEEETAVEWPDRRVGKLVMVEKYHTKEPEDDNTTLVILVLAAILLCAILFNK